MLHAFDPDGRGAPTLGIGLSGANNLSRIRSQPADARQRRFMNAYAGTSAPQAGFKTQDLLLPFPRQVEIAALHLTFFENPNGADALYAINTAAFTIAGHHVPRTCLKHQANRFHDAHFPAFPTFVINGYSLISQNRGSKRPQARWCRRPLVPLRRVKMKSLA